MKVMGAKDETSAVFELHSGFRPDALLSLKLYTPLGEC